MRTVEIRKIDFIHAFEMSVDSRSYTEEQTIWLDKKSGDVIYVFVNDEDAESVAGIPPEENRELREQIDNNPDDYVEIPGMENHENREILLDFLNSDWTDDEAEKEKVRSSFRGHIGKWKRSLNNRQTLHAWYDFKDDEVEKLAEQFLESEGIQVKWR